MANEQRIGVGGSEAIVGQPYHWTWPQGLADSGKVGSSRDLFDHFRNDSWGTLTIANIMSANNGPIDLGTLGAIYHEGERIRGLGGKNLTLGERTMYGSLRDALEEWFVNADWMVQPPLPQDKPARLDDRYHRLLLPAHMLNFLTKLVENRAVPDAGRGKLIHLSDKAYEATSGYIAMDNLETVVSDIENLRGKEALEMGVEEYGFDIQSWLDRGETLDRVGERAKDIRFQSRGDTLRYFRDQQNASGLYFMKSVVIGAMQEWHHQRLGMTGMVPPILARVSEAGHGEYNFATNSEKFGDMHVSDHRFPFQRYVARYMIDQAG